MTIKTITVTLLCALPLAPLVGCDLETEDPASLASDVEEGDAASSSAQIEDALAVEVDPAGSITYALTYEGMGTPAGLADGDIVMIKNYKHGYLGCFSGSTEFAEGPNDIDNYVWQVHEVDIDGDGSVEFQFELIDDTGPTGTFLKMDDEGDVLCDVITGIGDAAAWHQDSHQLSGGGTFYRKRHFQLENYKQDLCMKGSTTTALSTSCSPAYWGMAFWVEVIA